MPKTEIRLFQYIVWGILFSIKWVKEMKIRCGSVINLINDKGNLILAYLSEPSVILPPKYYFTPQKASLPPPAGIL